jgi:hypothetical protein
VNALVSITSHAPFARQQILSYDPFGREVTRMKLLLVLVLLFCSAISGPLCAQVVDASTCDILSNPQSFDGKIVRLKGTVSSGFEEFVVKDSSCGQPINAIWLAYPDGTKGKAGPAAFLRLQLAKNNPATATIPSHPAVKLDKNKDFKQFDALLSTPYKAGGMCLGCTRYTVTATLVGRLDGVKDAGVVRDGSGKFISANGFGNLNLYRARLVLQSVADLSSHEIDYSGVSASTKDDSTHDSGGGDPVAAAHQAARAFGPDSQAGNEVERAAAAYGKQGEDNGVQVGFGTPNEVPKNDGATSDNNSPDGLVLDCTFDMDRLKGDALARAIAHVGTHIADLRSSGASAPTVTAYDLEYRAWKTTVLGAVAFQQKTLTAPGGYLLWNAAWPAAERNKKVDEGITSLLRDGEALKK